MSKSGNMLRTRRRDNNVKPNRRLDRKSSRGMIYENEELRLKTININAEIERGQSDIKKLKRENEMLKKEIWCLRDEYEKLDKMLKEKEIDFSSSSTTCSSDDSQETCSSCSEESEEVETSQNLENVQKTNLKNFHTEFDHLSVVPEENSPENSEKNSTTTSWPNDASIIKPDQSYPCDNICKNQENLPKHFFAPLSPGKTFDDCLNYQSNFCNTETNVPTDFLQNMPAVPKIDDIQTQNKTSTDLIVKMDNRNFQTTPTQSTFSNGGNLEELLNDIETISQDILKMSNAQNQHFINTDNTQLFSYGGDGNDIVSKIQNSDLSYVQNTKVDNFEVIENDKRPFKSELNVVLMPTPMPLIGFDKYRNISCDSLHSKSIENLSTSTQNLRIIPDNIEQNIVIGRDYITPTTQEIRIPYAHITPTTPLIPLDNLPPPIINESSNNPFFFGNMQDTYFNARYNPDNYNDTENKTNENEICNSKSNLLDTVAPVSDHVSSENEENLKFKTSKVDESKTKANIETTKSPKSSIKRKVSIHFKGKRDKSIKKTDESKTTDKKHSIFDLKSSLHRKTPSIDSKKSVSDPNILEPKATSSDSKTSTDNKKYSSSSECKLSSSETPNKNVDQQQCSTAQYDIKMPDSKTLQMERKQRKSSSVSPDRKHVHLKEDGSKKAHKKHRKSDRVRSRRSTISNDRLHMRERSYSVCTDRSNILTTGFGSNYLFDDFTTSDRERTNSLSSCETVKTRKMSNMSNIPLNGKIPWCGCWGNGCL